MSIQRTLQKCLDDWKEISRLDFCLLDLNSQPFCATCSRQLPSASRLEEFSESSALCMAAACTKFTTERNSLISLSSGDPATAFPPSENLPSTRLKALSPPTRKRTTRIRLCRNSCWEIIRKWKPLTRQKNCVSAPPPAGRGNPPGERRTRSCNDKKYILRPHKGLYHFHRRYRDHRGT